MCTDRSCHCLLWMGACCEALKPIDAAVLLLSCSDIDFVEFQRQGGGVISSSVRTFDLLIKQKSNNTVRYVHTPCSQQTGQALVHDGHFLASGATSVWAAQLACPCWYRAHYPACAARPLHCMQNQTAAGKNAHSWG